MAINTESTLRSSKRNISKESTLPLRSSRRNISRESAMHEAVRNNKLTTIATLIKKGASLSMTNEYGSTPLHMAISNGKTAIAKLLIRASASSNLNVKNCSRRSPIHLAIEHDNAAIVSELISHGANLNVKYRRMTPFSLAVGARNYAIMELLIVAGANLIGACFQGCTPIYYAISCADANMIKLFIKYRSHPSLCFNDRQVFNYVVSYSGAEIVKLFVPENVNIHYKNTYPLLTAVEHGRNDTVKLLINAGANVNVINGEGATALHIAIEQFEAAKVNSDATLKIINELLIAGVNINIRDKSGNNASDVALRVNDAEIIALVNPWSCFNWVNF